MLAASAHSGSTRASRERGSKEKSIGAKQGTLMQGWVGRDVRMLTLQGSIVGSVGGWRAGAARPGNGATTGGGGRRATGGTGLIQSD